jgi:UDP-N-acetylglucosamine transferase subunit ALG13
VERVGYLFSKGTVLRVIDMTAGTFISLGNSHQSFGRLLKNIEEFIDELPKPILIQRGHTEFSSKKAEVITFMDMNAFERAINSHSLIILHGGAGSIIQAVFQQKVPVVMARRKIFDEHIDDHQVEFVAKLSSKDLIISLDLGGNLLDACDLALGIQKKLVEKNAESKLINSLIQADLDSYANI